MHRLLFAIAICWLTSQSVQAQVTPPTPPESGTQIASLEDYLVNSLRATLPEQRTFIKLVEQKVENGELERKLVLAVLKYAHRRHSRFPFPFFERAMRIQAAKQDVTLPATFTIRSSRAPLF